MRPSSTSVYRERTHPLVYGGVLYGVVVFLIKLFDVDVLFETFVSYGQKLPLTVDISFRGEHSHKGRGMVFSSY